MKTRALKAEVKPLRRFVVYHKSLVQQVGRRGGRVFDGIFVVYAFDKDKAQEVVAERLGDSYNDSVVISLPDSSDREGQVELEFWYEQPAKIPKAA